VSEFEVNAAVVAELRRETGAGMMDCKKALLESKGDKDKALEYLRKKGKAAAEKRADRSANEGIIAYHHTPDGRTATLVEVNSETDFVAKNEAFKKYAHDVAEIVLGWGNVENKTVEDLKKETFPSGATIGDVLSDMIGKIGEKLEIRRFVRLHTDTGYIGHYIHSDSKLGVLVVLEGVTQADEEAHTLGRDLAMQIAASVPSVVERSEVPAEKVGYEKNFHTEQTRAGGKPEPVVEKIVLGKLDKWFSEIVLMEQPFVKDPKITIKSLIEDVSKNTGKKITVKQFVRFRVGA
jgi:elongation factor Ts